MRKREKTPRWVWAIVLGVALIEPAVHVWILAAPPENTAPTGLHTLDTYVFVTSLQHARGAFFSPYAPCDAACGVADLRYYALVYHHVYGALGALNPGLPLFVYLGILNGLGVAALLAAAWCFFRGAAPNLANKAFLLFALGGGLGGVLYIALAAAGFTESPQFAEAFQRFFFYDLNEGARFQPYLLTARLYYTLPYAFGLAGLAALLRALGRPSRRVLVLAAAGLGLCTLINFRIGPMLWAVGMLICIAPGAAPRMRRASAAAAGTLGTALGVAGAFGLLALNPVLGAGAVRTLNASLLPVSFLSATLLFWLVLPGALRRALLGAPRWLRAAGFGLAGFVLAYLALYAGYQAYYGNWLHGGEASASVAVSDWALLAVIPGTLFGWFLRRRKDTEEGAPVWAALWLLGFLALGMGSFGQGWYRQLLPERCLVVLGPPLALLAADGLARLERRRPAAARALAAAIVGCGLVSIWVTWAVAYGPLGYGTLQTRYPWTRNAFMAEEDARLLDTLEEGVVLAPAQGHPLFGDVVAQRPGMRTVFGIGTLDHSGQMMPDVRSRVARFFTPGTGEEERRALIEDWCVDYVFCPVTTPVADETLAEFRQLDWLRETASADGGAVFKVMP